MKQQNVINTQIYRKIFINIAKVLQYFMDNGEYNYIEKIMNTKKSFELIGILNDIVKKMENEGIVPILKENVEKLAYLLNREFVKTKINLLILTYSLYIDRKFAKYL